MRLFVILLLFASSAFAQDIPSRWDELTASDWPKALEKSARTCILPIGILEKHGPHAPLGSDLIHVREWAARATKNEYAVVFPDYFYGQVYEAQQQPGTFALPSRLVWDLLDATVEEIARNGFDKIVIVNGHGGSPQLLRYFVQSQLEKRRDYVVYFFDPVQDPAFTAKVNKMRKTDPAGDQHAGERETSTLLYLRPDLVKQERATQESGENLKRLDLPNLYTGIWWYASYPNHYAGEGAKAKRELGKLLTENQVEALTQALKVVKADTKTLEIQKEYFDRVDQLGEEN
ncbi:creatinine amidohydrolase [Pontibacter ummariensis]|uniref:Creatinine amidohydrolase n=1 Tax=Pontibacter ummariensis TaxID=1610492 RepID=A0A239B8N0_9BACT|nr:creatininase family protein [Pontibacter ummariensis]PRY16388.1 creatinine amidohydrolase [Pontibacter ummariensis]SNS04280.1 creatinine amidohydrolase [Pontibacter ummariensis]